MFNLYIETKIVKSIIRKDSLFFIAKHVQPLPSMCHISSGKLDINYHHLTEIWLTLGGQNTYLKLTTNKIFIFTPCQYLKQNQMGIFICYGESTHIKLIVSNASFIQHFKEKRKEYIQHIVLLRKNSLSHKCSKPPFSAAKSPTTYSLSIVHVPSLQVFPFSFQNNLGLISFWL